MREGAFAGPSRILWGMIPKYVRCRPLRHLEDVGVTKPDLSQSVVSIAYICYDTHLWRTRSHWQMSNGQRVLVPTEWYTTQEAAQYLRVSSRTIYKWCPPTSSVTRGQGDTVRWIWTTCHAYWKKRAMTILNSVRSMSRLGPETIATSYRLPIVWPRTP